MKVESATTSSSVKRTTTILTHASVATAPACALTTYNTNTDITDTASSTNTKTDIPLANTATSTGPVEDKPKIPPWQAALKQRKEAEIKKKDEEQKKLVSSQSCT